MSKKNKEGEKKTLQHLKNTIFDFLSSENGRQYNHKQVAAALDIFNRHERELVARALEELADENRIVETDYGRYMAEPKKVLMEGVLQVTSKGSGFVITEQSKDDIFIPKDNLNHALDGDQVTVMVRNFREGKRPEGEVVEILKRAHEQIVGIVEISKKFAFVVPTNQRIHVDLFIPLEQLNGARHGEKVIAKITDWPARAENPFGKIIEVLGKPGKHEVEMHAILAEFGLPYRYPEEVEQYANTLSDAITDEEIAKRRDFRSTTTFTIDPFDAKDFDDALSVKFLRDDRDHGRIWEIGVHIADVAHYVKPGTILDNEAYSRATSVYLVDRVVPMLPEILSNQICSLRPNEDKLTYSVVFEMNEKGRVLNEWFGRTVIHSCRRFTYEEAQEIIETGEGDLRDEILLLDKIAKIFRKQRMENGALELHSAEVKFKLDENGKPIGVYTKVTKDSNKLIEEFMLLANKAVARVVGKPEPNKKMLPMVYRVHDEPNEEKVSELMVFVKSFGHRLPLSSTKVLNKALNKLLEEIPDKHTADVIQTFAIRCMAKAVYSPENIGHFGLAFDYYTHFTSPIRRYPDLMVHRILTHFLNKSESFSSKSIDAWCKHSSMMEKKAADAERASIKYKQVEFLRERIGQEFTGIVSGLTEWGIYVELDDNKCEGMITLRNLRDDAYYFDERNYQVVGTHRKKVFKLGDHVKVKVMNADLIKKQIDFELVTKDK